MNCPTLLIERIDIPLDSIGRFRHQQFRSSEFGFSRRLGAREGFRLDFVVARTLASRAA